MKLIGLLMLAIAALSGLKTGNGLTGMNDNQLIVDYERESSRLLQLDIASCLGSPLPESIKTAWFDAANFGNTKTLEKLLKDFPGLLNVQDAYGQTAVYITSEREYCEATAFLIDKNADTSICDKFNRSAVKGEGEGIRNDKKNYPWNTISVLKKRALCK